MNTQYLTEKLQKLKLSAMVDALQEQIDTPLNVILSFEERLGLLLDRELIARENRRIQHLLRSAKLRQSAYIEDIIYSNDRELNKSNLLSLANLDFIKHKQNILITGPTGVGKSYLACAFGHQACRNNFSVRYLRMPQFIDELTVARADGSLSRLLLQLSKIDLLILDDFGLTPLTASVRNDVFNLIEDRHQLKSTIITSQLPVKDWHSYIAEPTVADALMDRLLEHTHRIDVKGESMRRKKHNKY
jgi:DNA replication protein DnaC